MDHRLPLLEITHANAAKKGGLFANIMLDLYANIHIIM